MKISKKFAHPVLTAPGLPARDKEQPQQQRAGDPHHQVVCRQ